MTNKALGIVAGTALCTLTGSTPAASQDPVSTDGDKYRVVVENDLVRVLRYHDVPGVKTHLHRHPNFVMVALAPFRRRLTFGDGSTKVREFKAGETAYMTSQLHSGENIGDTPTEALLVELKSKGGAGI